MVDLAIRGQMHIAIVAQLALAGQRRHPLLAVVGVHEQLMRGAVEQTLQRRDFTTCARQTPTSAEPSRERA
jgi:hypothetical protein